MAKKLRTLALLLAGALALSACGLISSLIPDQTIDDGVMGVGAAGVEVTFVAEAQPAAQAVGPNAMGDTTTFVGQLDLVGVQVEPLDLGNVADAFARVRRIVETLSIEASADVVFAGQFDSAEDLHPDHLSFTLNSMHLGGRLVIEGNTYTVPQTSAAGLNISFAEPSGFLYDSETNSTVVTYQAGSASMPEWDVSLGNNNPLLQAVISLLQDGGELDVHLTATAQLGDPGLPASADLVFTIVSEGAVVSF